MKMSMGRRRFLQAGAACGVAGFAMPSIVRASSDPIVIAHMTPRTGFLSPQAEFAVNGFQFGVDQLNAEGGINGRLIEVLTEDSVNPQTATTKAERFMERPDVAMILGEISSASALSISQVAARANRLFINTGANSDELRGVSCKRVMFHTEAQNAMYINTAGYHLLESGQLEGKKWFILSADYAFGHDLLKGAKAFLERSGASVEIVGDELIPTDTTDFSSQLLNIRATSPDLVILNLAGQQNVTFWKQYGEFGLDIPLAGFDYGSAMAWATGAQDFKGTWPCIWTHQVQTDGSQAFTRAFREKYGKPPENQGYTDYIGVLVVGQAMRAVGGTDTDALIEYLEDPATEFDILKHRKGRFDPATHQLLQEAYTVTALDPSEVQNEFDIFTTSEPLPGPDEPLTKLTEGAVGGACSF